MLDAGAMVTCNLLYHVWLIDLGDLLFSEGNRGEVDLRKRDLEREGLRGGGGAEKLLLGCNI